MGVKQRDAVKASASGNEFTLFAHHVVCDQDDIASLQPFSRSHFLGLLRVQDPGPPAAVTEDSDSF